MNEKNELKEKIRAEEQERTEHNRIQQEKLFAKAKMEMRTDLNSNPNNNWNNNNSSYGSRPSYYTNAAFPSNGTNYLSLKQLQEQEQMINAKATKQATNYLSKMTENNSLNFEKVFGVYKLYQTNQETITMYIESMDSLDNANSYFKKIALLLHPDKNCHPLAEQAFKKVKEAYDTAKTNMKRRFT